MSDYLFSPENNLSKSKEANGYQVGVIYRPTDLLVHQQLNGQVYDSASVNLLRRKYNDYYYFILRLSKNSQEALQQLEGGLGQYSDVMQTLSFRMDHHVSLTTSSRDTIPVSDFALNRTFGFSQSTDLLFVFNKDKAVGAEWVQFNLREFGLGLGGQTFRFSCADLAQVLQIDFEKAFSKID